MDYISSDTNIWIDFQSIQRLEMPFRLNYAFLLCKEVLNSELRSPDGFAQKLLEAGLQQTEIDESEFWLALKYRSKYRRLSKADAIALAIAKNRSIILLSGDGALRRAAEDEGVVIRGTIWIFDELLKFSLITEKEYVQSLQELKTQQNNGRRLPIEEIDKRIQKYQRTKD